MMNLKTQVARLSVLSNTLLIILKFIVGIITGSVSIISEAIHSAMDLLAAIIAFFSVRISGIPPDREHPYGHGKYENISGVIESLLILIASAWIIYEAIMKFIKPSSVDAPFWGVIVMLISSLVNIYVSRRLYKVAKLTDSVALEADALHLKTDIYTSAGVGFGLLLLWITGLNWLDPLIAIFVALFIIYEAIELTKRAFKPLVDVSINPLQLNTVNEILLQFPYKFHDLKTRKAGSDIFIEFHIEMPKELHLDLVHDTCDKIEEAIRKAIPTAQIMIHAEPV